MHGVGISRIGGLDGIRALAVAAVIVFHADLNHFLPGGFLGVDVFFVLSGFLITSLLLAEVDQTGRISLLGFYARRSKRLLPALLTVLLACAAYTAAFAPDAVRALRDDIPPALLYYSNVWQLIDAQPYFERFGRPHALQHLWSLAIEEQFYLVWPPVVLLLYRCRKAVPPAWAIALLALASTLWMGWLAELNNIPYENPPERLYFGTDTHAMGLLVGACLAACYRPGALSAVAAGAWDALGFAALACLTGAFLFLDESGGFLYRGGFAGVSLATAVLVLSASREGTRVNRLFSLPLADWLGKRSYGLYLWHWPVFVYFRPGEELTDDMALAFLIRLALTVLLSDLSYRFIEQPVRRDGWRAFGRFSMPAFAAGAVALVAAVAALHLQTPLPATEAAPPETAEAGVAEIRDVAAEVPLDPKAFISAGTERGAYPLDLTDVRVTALGDSVMLGARPVLARKLPLTTLDAQVGRQGSDLLKLVQRLSEEKTLSDTVLIHVGTNGYIYEQNLKQILHLLRDRKQVVFINVHADRRWTEDNNALLRKYQQQAGNVTLIDWHGASEAHPEYFVKDGIHLTGKGMLAYAELARVALGVPEMPNRARIAAGDPASPAAKPLKKVSAPAAPRDARAPRGETPAAVREHGRPDEAPAVSPVPSPIPAAAPAEEASAAPKAGSA